MMKDARFEVLVRLLVCVVEGDGGTYEAKSASCARLTSAALCVVTVEVASMPSDKIERRLGSARYRAWPGV